MYTDKDLESAVEKGVFSASEVSEFQRLMGTSTDAKADEENFRLVGGFNDIFVVIASVLLLFSIQWMVGLYHQALGYAVFSVLSWFLTVVFVSKRKMALPAIALLLAFIGGSYGAAYHLLSGFMETPELGGVILSALAASIHWRRFKVPITVSAGTGAALYSIIILMVEMFPDQSLLLFSVAFICGCVAFILAMRWDASDTARTTGRSDVAFWLHLLAAPLIIHPVFFNLGVLNGNDNIVNMLAILVLYVLMTIISIVIDRRAFMVSSMLYAVYALSSIVNEYGEVGYGFALTGAFIAASLLLLSAYWQVARSWLLIKVLPTKFRLYVPSIKSSQ